MMPEISANGPENDGKSNRFEQALEELPEGYTEGHFRGRRWGATVRRSSDLRRTWLYAEDLSGADIVSFNFYVLASGECVLKPCEMSSSKVMDFVEGFEPVWR